MRKIIDSPSYVSFPHMHVDMHVNVSCIKCVYFSRQNLTFVDVRFSRLKSIPTL